MQQHDEENQITKIPEQAIAQASRTRVDETQNQTGHQSIKWYSKVFNRKKQQGLEEPHEPGADDVDGNASANDAVEPPRSIFEWLKAKASKAYQRSKDEVEQPEKDGYTTTSFHNLGRPIIVRDVFFNARKLILARLMVRYLTLSLGLAMNVSPVSSITIISSATFLVIVMEKLGIKNIMGYRVPTVSQSISIYKYPQWGLELIASKILHRKRLARLWWLMYLLVADIADFEQNFLNAWRRRELADDDPVHIEAEGEENPGEDQSGERDRPRKTSVSSGRQKSFRSSVASDAAEDHRLPESQPDSEAEANGADGSLLRRNVLIFVENEQLEVPLLLEGMDDSQLFKQLRMFYRYTKVKRGLVELVVPRKLVRVDCVTVEKSTQTKGDAIDTLDCGPSLRFFQQPDTVVKLQKGVQKVTNLLDSTPPEGLEFIRSLDRAAIGAVVLAPPTASLIFITVWLSVWLHRETLPAGVNLHTLIGSAFAIASFMVTAGGLIIALTAFLDNKEKAN